MLLNKKVKINCVINVKMVNTLQILQKEKYNNVLINVNITMATIVMVMKLI